MSVKSIQDSSHSELPQFPPEIWITILRRATLVPFALSTDLRDDFAYPPPPTKQNIQQDLLLSLQNKNNLTKVCKLWNTLATPYLYECAAVPTFQSFALLGRTLVLSRVHNDQRLAYFKEPLGRLVKRMDLMMVKTSPHDYNEATTYACGWISSRNLLPNIKIFISNEKSAKCHSVTLYFLRNNEGISMLSSLQVVDIALSLESEQTKLLGALIARCKNLKQLRCHTEGPLGVDFPASTPSQIQLWGVGHDDWYERSVEEFDATMQVYNYIRSLRHFVCFQSRAAIYFRKFLSSLGSNLETLDLNYYTYSGGLEGAYWEVLADACQLCPRLRSVIITLYEFETLRPRRWRGFPSVTNVGLRYTKKTIMAKRSLVNTMYKELLEIVTMPGTVRAIRILDQHSAKYLLLQHLPPMRRTNTLCKKHGIRLEGPDGRLLLV